MSFDEFRESARAASCCCEWSALGVRFSTGVSPRSTSRLKMNTSEAAVEDKKIQTALLYVVAVVGGLFGALIILYCLCVRFCSNDKSVGSNSGGANGKTKKKSTSDSNKKQIFQTTTTTTTVARKTIAPQPVTPEPIKGPPEFRSSAPAANIPVHQKVAQILQASKKETVLPVINKQEPVVVQKFHNPPPPPPPSPPRPSPKAIIPLQPKGFPNKVAAFHTNLEDDITSGEPTDVDESHYDESFFKSVEAPPPPMPDHANPFLSDDGPSNDVSHLPPSPPSSQMSPDAKKKLRETLMK